MAQLLVIYDQADGIPKIKWDDLEHLFKQSGPNTLLLSSPTRDSK